MTTGPLPATSKCKSVRFNAWGHSSTHRTILSGRLRLWFWCGFKWRATSCHLTFSKSAWKSTPKCVPGCAESLVIPWCQSGSWWQTLGVQQDSAPAHKSKETQAWLQKECYDFVPFSHWPPPPQPKPAGLLCLVICREHQHNLLTTPKLAWSPPFTEYFAELLPALVKLRHAPSSGSISRRWLRLKAAT